MESPHRKDSDQSPRGSSYGTTETVTRHHRQRQRWSERPHVCGLGGPDAPALLLLWLLLAQVLLPAALVRDVVPAALATGLSVLVALGLFCLSRSSGWPWRIFCLLLLVAAFVGLFVGLVLRSEAVEVTVLGTTTMLIQPRALCFCIFSLFALLSVLLVLSWLMPKVLSGFKLRGSSSRYGDPDHVKPHEYHQADMQFGCPCDNDVAHLLVQDNSHYAEELMSKLLHGHCFWSGEPVLDYVFHLANQHLVWGCFFCHPAHPFDKFKRIFLLVNVALLIVFPVAAFSAIWRQDTVVRLVLQFLLVTAPRSLLRFLLKKTGTMEGEIVLHHAVNREEIRRTRTMLRRGQGETSDLYRNEEGVWRHQLSEEELAALASARRWEATFLIGSSLVTAATCLLSVLTIKAHREPLAVLLLENSNGVLFAFYIDSVFDLLSPRSSGSSQGWCFGFFHQWLVERGDDCAAAKTVHATKHPKVASP